MTDDDTASGELREALVLDGKVVTVAHPHTIKVLGSTYPHTIVHIPDAKSEGTCGTYAFGLCSRKGYWWIAELNVFAGRDFMEWLMRHHLVPRDGPPQEGDIVLYFHNDIWAHIGTLVDKGRVRSKWGTFPIYEHGLFELPATYGDQVIYMQPLDPDDAFRLFLEYASSKGVPEDEIELARR